MVGGAGNDTIYLGTGTDWAKGGAGNDKIFGDSVGGFADRLVGEGGSDWIYGGGGGDYLVGGSLNPSMYLNNADLPAVQEEPGVADYFLFRLGEGDDVPVSPTDPYNWIADFEDGVDLIGYHNGTSWNDNAFSEGELTASFTGGATQVVEASSSDLLFLVNGNVTFDDTDLVSAIAISGQGIA